MGKISLLVAAESCAKEYTITGVNARGEDVSEKVWIRTPTATEQDQMRAEQELFIARLRKQFAEDAPRGEALMLELEDQEAESLAHLVVIGEMSSIGKQAEKKLPRLMPLDTSKYSTESQIEKARDEYEKRVQEHKEMTLKAMQELQEARIAELVAMPHAELVRMAFPCAKRYKIGKETENLEDDLRIYYSIYDPEDKSTRVFSSIDEVRSLQQTTIRICLLAAIDEVDYIKDFDVKNSQGRSVLQIEPAENTPEVTQESSTADSPEPASPKKNSRGGRKGSSTESQ